MFFLKTIIDLIRCQIMIKAASQQTMKQSGILRLILSCSSIKELPPSHSSSLALPLRWMLLVLGSNLPWSLTVVVTTSER